MAERIPEKCKNYGGESEPRYIYCYRMGTLQKIEKLTCDICPDYAEKK